MDTLEFTVDRIDEICSELRKSLRQGKYLRLHPRALDLIVGDGTKSGCLKNSGSYSEPDQIMGLELQLDPECTEPCVVDNFGVAHPL